ncbi:CidA/LrgA family protein [Brevibacillus reuszeri]|uniref:CidA/LrgA family protein n=1 Tax=Brevibacillus reuszeri TaxID=54915 RepID=UPI00289B67CC|nr:CidA/LrgA family protein [Brevibacillus reuszeri]
MKIVRGIVILLVFYGVGMAASKWLHIPLPGNLLGMLILTLGLCMGWIRMNWVEQASSFLVRHMMLFFVPIIVGVASYMNLISQDPWPILVALVVGPMLVMLVTGRVVQWYLKRYRQKKEPSVQQEGGAFDA